MDQEKGWCPGGQPMGRTWRTSVRRVLRPDRKDEKIEA